MPCELRKTTGWCRHHQCLFRHFTGHGFQCVQIIEGYCQFGFECIEQCPLSFKRADEEKVNKCWAEFFREGGA